MSTLEQDPKSIPRLEPQVAIITIGPSNSPFRAPNPSHTYLLSIFIHLHICFQFSQYRFPSLNTSPNSSNGLRINLVSFHRFGVRNPYVLPTAMNVALSVFSRVLVEPEEEVYASSTPASCRRRFTAGEATRPVPRGAGMSCSIQRKVSTSVFGLFDSGLGEMKGEGF